MWCWLTRLMRRTRMRPRRRWRPTWPTATGAFVPPWPRSGGARRSDGPGQGGTDVSYSDRTRVFPRLLDLDYPEVDRGEGVRLYTTYGRELLDACSGGAMIACLGHGARPVIDAAYEQGRQIAYVYNHHFTNEPQERLAERRIAEAAPEMARVRFASGGSEANEGALRLIRQYHVARGDSDRWRIISPSQAYHGATIGTLALSGRPALHDVYGNYLSGAHLHIPPARRDDPDGAHALAALDRAI